MKKVSALVLTGFGLNCDMETAHAFQLAGAEAQRVHINSLISERVDLDQFDILAFGGGFSWGDDHGAGVIQALKLKNHMGPKIIDFVGRGNLVIGICNGFQTLVNLGLLPGIDGDYKTRSVALTWNDCGNFRDQWVHLSVDPESPCVFTKDMKGLELPVRHGEGKFVAAPEIMIKLKENHQTVLRYSDEKGNCAGNNFPINPNGSMDDIAGICDATGRVFGLMPHPEAYNHFTNHPDWTRRAFAGGMETFQNPLDLTPGVRIFKNGVDYILSNR